MVNDGKGQAIPVEVMRIGSELHTQDNRITSHPIFIVEQKCRVYGMAEGYTDTFELVGSDGEVYESHTEAAKNGVDAKWVGYVDRWEFVTACFTEAGCKDFLKIQGHNLKEPRIFAASGFRNKEWQTLREFLKGVAEPPAE